MPDGDDYQQLLDATILHLEELKRRGNRFVQVDRGALSELLTAPSAATRPAVSAPVPAARPVSAPTPAPALSPAPIARTISLPSVPAEPPRAPAQPQVAGGTISFGLPRGEREEAIERLAQTVRGCVQCSHLAAARRNVVFGVGDIYSPVMFVGEAPGADEDVKGEPFVGAAGQLLTKIIKAMGLERETVYIANVLKCRPDTPGQSSGNRKPTPEEMKTCLPFLQEQIRIIGPKVIVALGATAMEGLFGRSPVYITKARGQWLDFQGIAVMPTFHPSYVLRNQSNETKRQIWEDMLAVMERLGMEISAKQRGYYTKPS